MSFLKTSLISSPAAKETLGTFWSFNTSCIHHQYILLKGMDECIPLRMLTCSEKDPEDGKPFVVKNLIKL